MLPIQVTPYYGPIFVRQSFATSTIGIGNKCDTDGLGQTGGEQVSVRQIGKCFRLQDRIDIARANQKPLFT